MIGLVAFVVIVFTVDLCLPLQRRVRPDKAAPFVTAGLAATYLFLTRDRWDLSSLGMSLPSIKSGAAGALTVLVALGITAASGLLSGKLTCTRTLSLKVFTKYAVNISVFALLLIPLTIFTEELAFRGVIQRELSGLMHPMKALAVSSVIFGLWHWPFGKVFGLSSVQTLLYVFGTGMVGAVAGCFYQQSGSLLPAGIVHGLWNALSYTLFGMGKQMPGLLSSSHETITHPEYGVIGIFSTLTVLAVLLALRPL